MTDKQKHIIIVGGGIIGACSAYYLIRDDPTCTVTLFEKTGIASSASGKSGGFLALDWNDQNKELKNLTRQSFKLHQDLSNELDGTKRWGYRPVTTYSVILDTDLESSKDVPFDWLNKEYIRSYEQIGDETTTAQVTPELLTKSLVEESEKTGRLKVVIGKGMTELVYEGNNVKGIKLEDESIHTADAVVLCMGAWSGKLDLNGERIPVSGARVHSVVLDPLTKIPNQAIFTAILDHSKVSEPEVYPRPDGTVYLCGARDEEEPLPASSGDVGINNSCIDDLLHQASIISNRLTTPNHVNLKKKQACYLPISDSGLPIIGPHKKYKSLYLATGHSVWGILHGPITGKMISEWINLGAVKCVKY